MKVRSSTLRNGMRVVLYPTSRFAEKRVYLALAVRGGARFEERKNVGISHLLEHILSMPMDDWPGWQKMGGRDDATTHPEKVIYEFSFPVRHLERGFGFAAGPFRNVNIEEADLEGYRRVVAAEYAEDLDFRIDLILLGLFERLVWEGHPRFLDSREFCLENLSNLTLEKIQDFRKRFYTGQNMAICAVGDFRPAEVLAQMEAHFGEISSGEELSPSYAPLRKRGGPWVVQEFRQTDHLYFFLGFAFPGLRLFEHYALRLLDDYLTHRLRLRLVNKELLIYRSECWRDVCRDGGYLGIQWSCHPSSAERSLRIVLDEFGLITREGIPQEKFIERRERYSRNLKELGNSPEKLALGFAEQALRGKKISPPSEAAAKVRMVGWEEVLRFARRYFRREQMALAVVGPSDSAHRQWFLEILESYQNS